jgi:hypothetical protein
MRFAISQSTPDAQVQRTSRTLLRKRAPWILPYSDNIGFQPSFKTRIANLARLVDLLARKDPLHQGGCSHAEHPRMLIGAKLRYVALCLRRVVFIGAAARGLGWV